MLGAGILLCPMAASAETIFTTDVSVGAGAATNPFSAATSRGGSGSITASVRPTVIINESTTTYRLGGYVSFADYLRQYNSNTNFGLTASAEHQASDVTNLTANISYSGNILGANDALFDPVDPLGTPDNLPVIGDDIAFNGLRQRRHNIQSSIGLSHRLSARDSVNASVSGNAIRFEGTNGLGEYNFFTQDLGYSRQLSENFNLGASVGFGEVDYIRRSLGDATIISPAITASATIGSRTTISGSLGASFSRVDTGLGKLSSTDLSASLQICRRAEINNFCLSGSRTTSPSSANGVGSQTSVSLGFGQKVSRDGRISLSGSYSRAGSSILNQSRSLDYVRTAIRYNHNLSRRISGYLSAGVSDTYGFGVPRKASIQLGIGLTVRLGNR